MVRIRFVLAVIITASGAFSGASADSTLERIKASEETFARNWPGHVRRETDGVAARCAGRSAPIHIVSPELLYRGSIDDMDVSTTGAVTVVDLSKSLVLVFTSTGQHDPSVQIPVGEGFTGSSLMFSENGRFLAWSSAFASYVFDIQERRFALALDQFGAATSQWIGNDLLLVGHDNYNMNVTTTSMLRFKNGQFQRDVLDTEVFGKGHVPAGSTAAPPEEFFYSDQFGKAFLGGDRVYSSVAELIRDHVLFFDHKSSDYATRIYRIGEHLLQVDTHDNILQKPEIPWSLVLRDGTSGKPLKSIPLSVPECVPGDMAVSSDESEIAMLIGYSVLMLDPGDLSVRAVYGLDAPNVALPEHIAFTPSGELVVWARALDLKRQSVFVYKVKN